MIILEAVVCTAVEMYCVLLRSICSSLCTWFISIDHQSITLLVLPTGAIWMSIFMKGSAFMDNCGSVVGRTWGKSMGTYFQVGCDRKKCLCKRAWIQFYKLRIFFPYAIFVFCVHVCMEMFGIDPMHSFINVPPNVLKRSPHCEQGHTASQCAVSCTL